MNAKVRYCQRVFLASRLAAIHQIALNAKTETRIRTKKLTEAKIAVKGLKR
jgi:hypothetical protein